MRGDKVPSKDAGAARGAGAARSAGGVRGAGPPPPVAVPRAPFVVLVLVVVVGGVLGILLLNTKINENAFVLEDLRQRQEALDQREQQLAQEVAQASSTTQLVAAARRLGLVDRGDDLEYLRLPRDPAGEPDGSRGSSESSESSGPGESGESAETGESDESGEPVGG